MSHESLNRTDSHTISLTPANVFALPLAPRPAGAPAPGPDGEEVRSDLDVQATVRTVLAVAARVLEYRQRVVAELGEEAAAPLDRLEPAGMALAGAQLEHLTAPPRVSRDRAALEEVVGRALYEAELLVDTLVRRGEIRRRDLPRRRRSGDPHGCHRLLDLVNFLRSECEGISVSSRATRRELEQAERAAWDLLTRLAQASRPAPSTHDVREAALEAAVHLYEATRGALAALGLNGTELERVAPALRARVLH